MEANAKSNIYDVSDGMFKADFRAYLEHSLRDPFTLNLRDCSLMEVVRICVNAKSKTHPKYEANVSSLIYNLKELESQFRVTLQPR